MGRGCGVSTSAGGVSYRFVHVPKTGGTSIRKALGLRSGRKQHSRAKYRDGLPAYSFCFAFVRNPWERMVSYRCRAGLDEAAWQKMLREFVDPQVDYICDDDGRMLVDFMGRFESLAEDFATVCRLLAIERTLPRLNASEHGHYREFYDEATKQLVARLYAEDIERFGYRF